MGYDKEGRAEMAYFERQGDHGNAELDRIAESLRDEDDDPVCETCGDTGRVHVIDIAYGEWERKRCPDCPTCNCGARLTRANLGSHRECWRIP